MALENIPTLDAYGNEVDSPEEEITTPNPYDPVKLLELFERLKKESFDDRWVWERDWLRDLLYVTGRQWIMWHPTRREWCDKRLQRWVPRPVTNKIAETVQAIRTTLAAIQLSIVARPVAHDTESIAAAEVTDKMAPLIHEEHMMHQVMREADFWLVTTGNAVLQTSWDTDQRANRVFIKNEQCQQCGTVSAPQDIKAAGDVCPACGAQQFAPAVDPMTGEPSGQWVAFGRGKTTALSPFEWACPANITRFDELPYIIRLRWRDRHWFEANRPDLVHKIVWEKNPSDRSLQIFKSLATTNDIAGVSHMSSLSGGGSSGGAEGVTEYELWLKPTPEFPEGLVMRVIGDKSPLLLEVPQESLPGPFPYKDIEGQPLFPFFHAQYEHMGGRLYGRSALSPLIQKQDQINQLDSQIQLHIQRMANPVWVVPEGSGVDYFSGEAGWVMKYNFLAAGGSAKPERLAAQEVPATLYQLRQQYLQDIEALSGTYDVIKGEKPAGVEAFSALQLLVERSQSRFTAVFQSRGEMYRKWFGLAIELERQFGPDQRTYAVVGPNKGYTFQHFENAQLQGQLTFVIEDGSNMPKTALGKRAAIEQANQMQLLNVQDPDQRYALLQQFGLSDLVPTLNFHVQAALQIQDAFERWVERPVGISPLVIKPWHDPLVHWTERIKWLNTDKMRQMMAQEPGLEPIITMHLQQLQMLLVPPAPPDGGGPEGPQAAGGGQAMSNSNKESGSTADVPKGNNDKGSQGQGPR